MRVALLCALLLGCGPSSSRKSQHEPDDHAVLTDTSTNTDTVDTTTPPACGTLHSAAVIGGPNFEGAPHLAEAPDGSMYVTGSFIGELTFDPGGPNETILNTPANNMGGMLIRYSPNGDFEWARALESPSDIMYHMIAATSDGDAILAGLFYSSITLGAGNADAQVLQAVGGADGWLVRFDADGDVLWSTGFGSTADDSFGRLDLLDDDSIVVAGVHQADVAIGLGEANQTWLRLPPGNATAAFLARYSSGDGQLTWAQPISGALVSMVNGLATQGQEISVTGIGSQPGVLTLGAGQPNEATHVAQWVDGFLAHYDDSGMLQWATFDVGPTPTALAIAPDGSKLVTGTFQEAMTLGTGLPTEVTLSATGFMEGYQAKYDSAGDLLWALATRSEPNRWTIPADIGARPDGGLIVVGTYDAALTVAPGQTLPARGSSDIFVAAYNADGTLDCARQIAGIDADVATQVLPLRDGSWVVAGYFETGAAVSAASPDEIQLVGGGMDIVTASYAF